jgi:hypothetical protein
MSSKKKKDAGWIQPTEDFKAAMAKLDELHAELYYASPLSTKNDISIHWYRNFPALAYHSYLEILSKYEPDFVRVLFQNPLLYRNTGKERAWLKDWNDSLVEKGENPFVATTIPLPKEPGYLEFYNPDTGRYEPVMRDALQILQSVVNLRVSYGRCFAGKNSMAPAWEGRTKKVAERWDSLCDKWQKIMDGNSGMSRTAAAEKVTWPKDPKGLIMELKKRGLWDRKD